MLSSCRAVIVAQTPPQNRSLVKLAERAGFGAIGTTHDDRGAEAEKSDVLFFLLHHRLPDAVMSAVIRSIRVSEQPAIRYAPVALIIDDCPFETVLKYVRFGFDDVITLPERRDMLIARFVSQLETEHTYFETADYLGPDRRRMELAVHRDERRVGEIPFTRLTIHRSTTTGVRLLRQEIVGRAIRPPGEPLRQRPSPQFGLAPA
jgi:hypothetical protein